MAASEPEKKVQAYLRFVNVIDDAQIVIKKEKAEELKKSEQSGNLYNILLQYTQKLKLKASIDRNLLQAKMLSQKLNIQALFTQGHKENQGTIRPQNIVRFYEKALKSMRSQKQLFSGDSDPLALLQTEFEENY